MQNNKGYAIIPAQQAKQIMDTETGYIILDVRTKEEYENGHIPGAHLLPNEEIGEFPIPSLPDKNQRILLYCYSGVRSRQAAEKLAKLGYTNLYSFGGIKDWPYQVKQKGKNNG